MKCPQCGGKNLIIREFVRCVRQSVIKGNKLFQSGKLSPSHLLTIWMHCDDCAQSEDPKVVGASEWMCSPEEEQKILSMLLDVEICGDITEFMKD